MAGFRHLITTFFGVRHYLRDDGDGAMTVASFQDTDAIIDRNKEMAAFNDGYSPSREMRRVATLPMSVILKWLAEEGWNAFDPACEDKLAAKLNDPEYQHLRTAPGRLGVSNGVMR